MSSLKFGIIIPVWNSSEFLTQCIESLLQQSYHDFIAIFIDDGSTDSSLEILTEFAKTDQRIQVISQTNQGVAAARNRGLDALTQHPVDYVCFVDSDDYVSNQFLETFHDLITEFHAPYLVCGVCKHAQGQLLDPYRSETIGMIKHDQIFEQFFGLNTWDNPSLKTTRFLLNRCFANSLLSNLRFNEAMVTSEDQDFLFQILKKIDFGAFSEKQNYFYHVSSNSLSSHPNALKTELHLYESLLEDDYAYPKAVIHFMMEHAANMWWLLYKDCILKKNDELLSELVLIKNKLLCHPYFSNLGKKHKKRFAIANLGQCASKLYFQLFS